MINPQTTKPNAVLALAQYAYTRLEPLFAEAKATYPALQWTLQLTFANEESMYSTSTHLTAYALGTPTEFGNTSFHLTSMEEVDAYAAQLAADVASLQDVAA